MRLAGCPDATTLHNLVCTPRSRPGGDARFVINRDSQVKDAALVVVDEALMVGLEIGRHLKSFGVPILALGDPAQLPPVNDTPMFGIGDPDVMLTEVHRQAAGSAVLDLATMAREGRPIPSGTYGTSRVLKLSELDDHELLEFDQIIVHTNPMRHAVNLACRTALGRSSTRPEVGDKLVCEENHPDRGLYNGSMHRVLAVGADDSKKRTVSMIVSSLDYPSHSPVEVSVPIDSLMNPHARSGTKRKGVHWMSYGYAITAHKAQGSEWRRVLVIDEQRCFHDDRNRWLYTALTRASERVVLAGLA
jgi:exodeoxyribonuclease V